MTIAGLKKPKTYQKYASFFRLRFVMGLQYRAAALAGIVTQFAWGFMEIKVFLAFEQSSPAAFPMTFGQLAAYEWLQQAFLAFFMAWMMEPEMFECITDGNVSYELCRPVDLYHMWFARSMATRLSRGLLRCFPILTVAALLPEPYRLMPPCNPAAAVWFVITMLLGLAVTVALCMIIYMSPFSPCRRWDCGWCFPARWNFYRARSFRFLSSLRLCSASWNGCPSPPCRMCRCSFTAAA